MSPQKKKQKKNKTFSDETAKFSFFLLQDNIVLKGTGTQNQHK